jgi:hypothetical protein
LPVTQPPLLIDCSGDRGASCDRRSIPAQGDRGRAGQTHGNRHDDPVDPGGLAVTAGTADASSRGACEREARWPRTPESGRSSR